MNVIQYMTRWSSFMIILCFHINSFSQFSVSGGFAYSFDGVDFGQNHVNINTHWEKKKEESRFQLSLGIDFTHKRIDYEFLRTTRDYSHDLFNHINYTKDYLYKAKVSYSNLTFGTYFDWSLIRKAKFKLYFGYFVQLGINLSENEKDHQMQYTYSEDGYYNGETINSVTEYPISTEPFNAINTNFLNFSGGIKLSPRQYFKAFFVQLDLVFGQMARSMYSNGQGSFHTEDLRAYDFLFQRSKPYFFSTGFVLGYNF